MNKETYHFIRYNILELKIVCTIRHLSTKIIKAIKKRMDINSYPYKFKYLVKSKYFKVCDNYSDKNRDIEVNLNMKVKLASCTHVINSTEDLFSTFNDPEDYEALHRFLWIRYHLSNNSITSTELEKINNIIVIWCNKYLNQTNRFDSQLVNQPYTLSERIVNICFFYTFTKTKMPEIVKVVLDKSADRLIKNLEFYHESFGNHLINNLRSILTYSLILNNQTLIDTFIVSFDDYLNQFVENGYTHDFSSHYQLLLYYWLYDLSYFSMLFQSKELSDICKKYRNLISKSVTTFYNNKSQKFTLVGDISPDLEPDYLIPLIDRNFSKSENNSILNLYS